jgi:hypothetical protein
MATVNQPNADLQTQFSNGHLEGKEKAGIITR